MMVRFEQRCIDADCPVTLSVTPDCSAGLVIFQHGENPDDFITVFCGRPDWPDPFEVFKGELARIHAAP